MAKGMKPQIKKPRSGNGAGLDDDGIEEVGSLPTGDDIKKHVASLSALRAKVSEISGKIGAEVKAAESDKNIHRGAASLSLRLVRMDAEKRDEFLRHFDSYRLQLGFGRQDDLFNDKSPDEPTFANQI